MIRLHQAACKLGGVSQVINAFSSWPNLNTKSSL